MNPLRLSELVREPRRNYGVALRGFDIVVRLAIDTPIALRGPLHLDGLLGYALTARGGDIRDIPLDRDLGVWMGTAGVLEAGVFGPSEEVTRRVKRIDRTALKEGTLDRPRIVDTRSPMRAQLTERETLAGIRAIWFAGVGDPDAAEDLLADIHNVGAMAKTGYGRITDRRVERVRRSESTGLRLGSGRAARTVALTAWRGRFGDPAAGTRVISTRPSPPYWLGDTEECVTPTIAQLISTSREAPGLVAP